MLSKAWPLKRLSLFLFSAVSILLLMPITGCNKPHDPEVAPAAAHSSPHFTATEENLKYLKVAVVQRTTAGASIALNGRVTFDEEHTAQVGSPVEGRVTRVTAKPGDTVRKGQSLLRLRSAVFTLTESAEEKARSALQRGRKKSGTSPALVLGRRGVSARGD